MHQFVGAAVFLIAASSLIPSTVIAAGAHVHGRATLNAVIDGERVFVELDTPAMNLVGFEHSPSSNDDHAALSAALAHLRDGESLFRFSQAAQCALQTVDVSSPWQTPEASDVVHAHAHADGHGHDDAAAHDDHDQHADFTAEYAYVCSNPGGLAQLDTGLFETFENLERIDAQVIVADRVFAERLSRTQTRIGLR